MTSYVPLWNGGIRLVYNLRGCSFDTSIITRIKQAENGIRNVGTVCVCVCEAVNDQLKCLLE